MQINEYQITFFVDDVEGSAHVAKPLIHIAKKFKSSLQIINITRHRKADLSNSMSVLQVALQEGDICQISASGLDAELACFVIKDVLAGHFIVVGSKNNLGFSGKLAERLPQFCPSSEVTWFYAKAQTELTKFECLKGISKLIDPAMYNELLLAFIKREERSSTSITRGIALPHVIFGENKSISIAVISNNLEMDWDSNIGCAKLVIAIVLPTTYSRDQIQATTNLTRNLIKTSIAERVLRTRRSIELQALLMYLMTRLLD
jgi:PTS system nitrogen regulatory IIA component